MTSVGVGGSEAVGCGAIEGEVSPLDRVVVGVGLGCLFDTSSSVAASATEALVPFFLAIRDLAFLN